MFYVGHGDGGSLAQERNTCVVLGFVRTRVLKIWDITVGAFKELSTSIILNGNSLLNTHANANVFQVGILWTVTYLLYVITKASSV